MAPFKPHLVVVLGMHRSGTSATTRGLQALGVELGERLTPGVAVEEMYGDFLQARLQEARAKLAKMPP